MKDKKKNSKRPELSNKSKALAKAAPTPIRKRAGVRERVTAKPAQKVHGDGEAKSKATARGEEFSRKGAKLVGPSQATRSRARRES